MRDDKIKGCIFGGAIGDALGFPVEFLSRQQIIEKYGDSGISNYEINSNSNTALISDNTQLSIYTASAIIKCRNDKSNKFLKYIYDGYLDWVNFQCGISNFSSFTWISKIETFHSYRAPGSTCITALRSGAMGTIEKPLNQSKGCGGIMRVAPIGLLFDNKLNNILKIDLLGAKAAAITHGHPLGYITAFLFVHIINRIVFNNYELEQSILEALFYTKQSFCNYKEMDYLENKIKQSIKLAKENCDDDYAYRILGEGWIAEETLSIAIFCALKYKNDFNKAICASVNHNGDSDSTGSICGNILGSYLGFTKIPLKFLDKLEETKSLNRITCEIIDSLNQINLKS